MPIPSSTLSQSNKQKSPPSSLKNENLSDDPDVNQFLLIPKNIYITWYEITDP